MKPTNVAERSAAELVERRAGAEGNAGQQSTRRAQDRESVSQALDRVRPLPPICRVGNVSQAALQGDKSKAGSVVRVPAADVETLTLIPYASCP
jgi:hypothetical protein